MPIRGYLSEWQLFDDGEPEGMTWYSPAIETALAQLSVKAQYIDLRTAEQQGAVPAEGWALVLTDVRPPDHNVIMQIPGTHEVTLSTTVPEIRAIIGDEGTDELFEGSNVDQIKAYFQNTHNRRMDRWQGRI
jgi:hypothetical protein